MIHVTCAAHAIHRVCECARAKYVEVDRLISSVKKIFCKAPSRIRKLHDMYPDLAVPPQPILTRWGTWIAAAIYYADNHNKILNVLNKLDKDESAQIPIAIALL